MVELTSKPLLVIISAPSGAGKTTIVKEIIKKEGNFHTSISYTTREKRVGEVDGEDYFFISQEDFQKKIDQDEFVEYAEIYGHFYGTCRNYVKNLINSNCNLIFDINWEGAVQMMHNTHYNFVSIFILPPSMKILHNRLKKRATDNDEEVFRRLLMAKNELKHSHFYDYTVVNDDLNLTILKILNIINMCKNLRCNIYDFWGKINSLSNEVV